VRGIPRAPSLQDGFDRSSDSRKKLREPASMGALQEKARPWLNVGKPRYQATSPTPAWLSTPGYRAGTVTHGGGDVGTIDFRHADTEVLINATVSLSVKRVSSRFCARPKTRAEGPSGCSTSLARGGKLSLASVA
jgi:hypothetical protein